jgi:hypothetical protein
MLSSYLRFKKLRTDWTILHDLPQVNDSHICHNKEHTDKTNSVVFYDFNGVKKWCYSSDLLKNPRGITVDSNSNIYVTGYKSNNVVVISPDGKRAKQLLGISDELLTPLLSVQYNNDPP